jgi:hypothetical protein
MPTTLDVNNSIPQPAPHSIEAEQAVLGAVLLDNSALSLARDLLTPGDFYRTAHQVLYQVMLSMADGDQSIDNITLTEALNGNGKLASIGGAGYLAELLTAVSSSSNIVSHARLVAQKARIRTLRNQLIVTIDRIEHGAEWEALAPMVAQLKDLMQETPPSGGFAPVSLAQLLDEPEPLEPDWTLEDILAAGILAAIVSKPKVGKSTLVYELGVAVAQGRVFLGRATKQGAVLILAMEEHRRDVKRRLRNLGADQLDGIHVHAGPLPDSPDTILALASFIKQHGIVLVIFDTLNAFWSVSEENDAGAVTQAIKPLLQLARESGATVLLIHHARKAEGEYGDEIRGSGALFSLLDVALILKRHTVDTQRRLTIISRYAESPPELLLELREHGYVSLGDPAASDKAARLAKLTDALTDTPMGVKAVAAKAGLPLKASYSLLELLAQQGKATRSGTGKRGAPFLYSKFVSVSTLKTGGPEETNSPQATPSTQGLPPDPEFIASGVQPLAGCGKTRVEGDCCAPTPLTRAVDAPP